jgi:RimJ/RimL family protein N-acetyltransferase
VTFLPAQFEVPTLLETELFRIRPITIHDVVKDYDAVMTNRERLWALFGDVWGWPPEDLTLEQDLIDLGWHQKEFQVRSSFTYAAMSPDEQRLLGCIYVDPPKKVGFDAEVYFWARAEVPNTGQENKLLEVVRRWVSEEWPFRLVAYPGRDSSWEEWHALPDRVGNEPAAAVPTERDTDRTTPVSRARFDRIESDRLVLRRFADSDLAPFLIYRNDPEVARYQAWESCTEQEAKNMIEQSRQEEPGEPGEWFQFAVELKETDALIGDCALKVEEDGRQAEVGYTLSREHQAKGYASEAVSCLLDYAFGDLGLHRVVAITDQENEPSIALLKRLGIRREGHFVQNAWFKGRWASEYLYAVLRDEWLQKPGEDADKEPRGGTT